METILNNYRQSPRTRRVPTLVVVVMFVVAGATMFASPAFAQTQKITTVELLLGKISSIIDLIIPFIIGLAVFVIIWGIFNYIVHADEEEKRSEAKKFIIWGVIGVFFMLSVWGFVNILLNSFNLETTINAANIPQVPKIGSSPRGGNNDPGNNNPGNNDPGSGDNLFESGFD